jgi:molybdopterin synthase catalytic subunit
VFELTEEPIDPAARRRAMAHAAAGAFVAFEGWVRDHNEGRAVVALEYEAYAALAHREGARILDEARDRFGVLDARAVHRTGPLTIGDVAVWVGVVAAHRDAAFAACRYVIDELKSRVPIWKHERYADGSTTWVNAAAGPAADPAADPAAGDVG